MKIRAIRLIQGLALILCVPAIAAPDDTGRTVEPTPVSAEVTGDENSSSYPERPPHEGVDENLFGGHKWYTPPPPPPKQVVRAPVKRVPKAPPLPFKLMGSYVQGESPTTFFLVKGGRVYDAKIGDTLDETYRVDGIADGQLMFTYLPLNESQGLRLWEQK